MLRGGTAVDDSVKEKHFLYLISHYLINVLFGVMIDDFYF